MVRASKISIPEINKNSKAVISEEVVTDNIDYEDVVQFEAFDNFCKVPVIV